MRARTHASVAGHKEVCICRYRHGNRNDTIVSETSSLRKRCGRAVPEAKYTNQVSVRMRVWIWGGTYLIPVWN